MGEPVTGTAAGVPFTVLPPSAEVSGPAPVVVAWHMIDAPRSDAAFAAALPLAGVPAWRVYLGMPLCGARMVGGAMDAVVERARRDAMLAYVDPFVRQAALEFPAALAELRERFGFDTSRTAVVGGSLGGAVALTILATREIPVRVAALINPAVRARSVVGLVEGLLEQPYPWNDEARQAADQLDFVARSGEISARETQVPLLLVSGEDDYPSLRTDAGDLVAALRERYTRPDDVRLAEVPGLAHPLAEEPGIEPAPQLPIAKLVDDTVSEWLVRHLG
ncbi:S9 family peptidase [Amycolatopsis sp. EV170708-02-1]|uniref:alpha/beta hydrolase family protein n=1 Tax=Amycolatopsis sp. EV170708-02-1 TaxID=2919322 RepID=UPI001F0C5ABA|nr:prolyl oligopeptidase family serine peptidase [Amycolatopsis sp. EV170708-02-1]UMP03708.1 prolyl oligopeptidase family serine peptidase [Amycolatopsis sp. EV170708-02-1]